MSAETKTPPQTDTPRTDEAITLDWYNSRLPALCRTLERELAEARATLEAKAEGEKWLSGMLCEIMAEAIRGCADAAVIANRGMDATHVLVCVQVLAKAAKELRAQRDALAAGLQKYQPRTGAWESHCYLCGAHTECGHIPHESDCPFKLALAALERSEP
jgi:hypothetical protein